MYWVIFIYDYNLGALKSAYNTFPAPVTVFPVKQKKKAKSIPCPD